MLDKNFFPTKFVPHLACHHLASMRLKTLKRTRHKKIFLFNNSLTNHQIIPSTSFNSQFFLETKATTSCKEFFTPWFLGFLFYSSTTKIKEGEKNLIFVSSQSMQWCAHDACDVAVNVLMIATTMCERSPSSDYFFIKIHCIENRFPKAIKIVYGIFSFSSFDEYFFVCIYAEIYIFVTIFMT